MSPPPDLSAASDQEVVAWARRGREEGYRELVHRYKRAVFARIYRIVGRPELAKDLTQEAFVRAVQALDRYRPELKLSTWLLSIRG